jgi:hypothetical protein
MIDELQKCVVIERNKIMDEVSWYRKQAPSGTM